MNSITDVIILGFGIAILAVFVIVFLVKNMNQKTEMGEDAFAATRKLNKQNQELLKKYNDLNNKVNLLNKKINALSQGIPQQQAQSRGTTTHPAGWICPKCSARVALSQTECPRCGYIRR